MNCGDKSPRNKALTSQRTPKLAKRTPHLSQRTPNERSANYGVRRVVAAFLFGRRLLVGRVC